MNSVELTYGYTVSAPGCSGGTTGALKVLVEKGPAFELVDSAKICNAYINLSSLIKTSPTNTKNNYVFGKSLVNWNPSQINVYPNISTKTIDTIYGPVVLGKISCIISL